MADIKATQPKTINCKLCGHAVLSINLHLKVKQDSGKSDCANRPTHKDGSEMTDAEAFYEYQRLYPSAPTMSADALEYMKKKQAEKAAEIEKVSMATVAEPIEDSKVTPIHGYVASTEYKTERVAANEILKMPLSKLCNSTGREIVVETFINKPFPEFVPDINESYVFNDTELVKDVLMMFTTGMPGYLWGHAGTGKSSLPTQIAARLNRPIIRSQHTASTEESHITGQILAKDGRTYFEAGLLTLAMKHGWIYLADEYDFAYPQILSLYQPVLEGEPLVLKEATPEWRRTIKHKHFAFVATGNTNGSGDETGLYQGTNQQNAANFSRFAIVSKVEYMPIDQEKAILMSYDIPEGFANKLVQFAKRARDAYDSHEISQPIGPRELLNAGLVGVMRGDPLLGIKKAYINKLPSAAAAAVTEFAQRIFG
ncbi:AAA family ATPase [Moellerella wisconsensis]|uniref:AAA family ATPase n=1 Tax=Moellerella wisconsensis TaxID=158849 RepID=A0ACD3YCQ6_9GAMM|nr:AAA family ATPase [Moellerella wisconsensis]UNH40932.1 AAA family ATPase [Moellerella wisconsensis]